MKERIKQIIDREHLTAARFADSIGVQRSSISHLVSGRNNPSLEIIQKILIHFNYINPDWFLHGQGEMYREELSESSKLPRVKEIEFDDLQDTTPPLHPTENPQITEKQLVDKKNKEEAVTTPYKPPEPQTEPPQQQPMPLNQTLMPPAKGKEIERIIVFYTDNSFDAYEPNKR